MGSAKEEAGRETKQEASSMSTISHCTYPSMPLAPYSPLFPFFFLCHCYLHLSHLPLQISVLLPAPLFLAIPTCLDGASLFRSLRLCPAPWPYFSFLQPCSTVHGNRKQHISMGQMSADPVLISEVKWGKMGA